MKALNSRELEANAVVAFNLKLKRAEQGMSQAELAKAVGISQSLLALLESGARTLTAPMCADIAEALSCEMSDIVGKRSA